MQHQIKIILIYSIMMFSTIQLCASDKNIPALPCMQSLEQRQEQAAKKLQAWQEQLKRHNQSMQTLRLRNQKKRQLSQANDVTHEQTAATELNMGSNNPPIAPQPQAEHTALRQPLSTDLTPEQLQTFHADADIFFNLPHAELSELQDFIRKHPYAVGTKNQQAVLTGNGQSVAHRFAYSGRLDELARLVIIWNETLQTRSSNEDSMFSGSTVRDYLLVQNWTLLSPDQRAIVGIFSRMPGTSIPEDLNPKQLVIAQRNLQLISNLQPQAIAPKKLQILELQ